VEEDPLPIKIFSLGWLLFAQQLQFAQQLHVAYPSYSFSMGPIVENSTHKMNNNK
jgi:hypothetical protein